MSHTLVLFSDDEDDDDDIFLDAEGGVGIASHPEDEEGKIIHHPDEVIAAVKNKSRNEPK